MEREPRDFERDAPRDTGGADDAFGTAPSPTPGIPSTDAEVAESIARAREDVLAGRVIPDERISEWLATWGAANEKPFPPEWLA